MKTLLLATVLACSAFFFSSCAGGPKYSAVADRIPPIPEHHGRIYFYRSGTFVGSAIRSEIKVNDAKVGSSIPGGFFFVDRPAGDYEVTTSTEVTNKLTFHLDENQTRYVKTVVSMGLLLGRIYPELVDASVGEKAVHELNYTGEELPEAPKP